MHLISFGRPTQLQPEDRAVVTIFLGGEVSSVKFFRGDRQLAIHNRHRGGNNNYIMPAHTKEQVCRIMDMIASGAGLSSRNTAYPAVIKDGSELIFVFEAIDLESKISERSLENHLEKVRFRVGDTISIIRDFNKRSIDSTAGFTWLYKLKNDLKIFAENPEAEEVSRAYQGWSSEEIRLLYYILYGEELEEETEKV